MLRSCLECWYIYFYTQLALCWNLILKVTNSSDDGARLIFVSIEMMQCWGLLGRRGDAEFGAQDLKRTVGYFWEWVPAVAGQGVDSGFHNPAATINHAANVPLPVSRLSARIRPLPGSWAGSNPESDAAVPIPLSPSLPGGCWVIRKGFWVIRNVV